MIPRTAVNLDNIPGTHYRVHMSGIKFVVDERGNKTSVNYNLS